MPTSTCGDVMCVSIETQACQSLMSGDRAKLKALVDELWSHPISVVFGLPMSESPYVTVSYSRKVRSPMHLSLIDEKICTRSYTYRQFEEVIQLIYENTRCYFGEASEITNAARGFVSLFEKLSHKYFVNDSQNWARRVVKLRTRMDDLFFYRPVLGQSIDVEIDFSKTIRSQILREGDIRNFMTAAQKLTDAADTEKMIAIVEEREPEMVSTARHLTLDLAKLKIPTIQRLVDFAQARFREKGMRYPTQYSGHKDSD
jgi:hypothetical protein